LTSATAGALAALGSLLGVIGAYVFLTATYRSELGSLTPLPLPSLVALVVGLPLVATAAGWLLAGREPPSFARQALD
jgi:putative ABC transport system permease protein